MNVYLILGFFGVLAIFVLVDRYLIDRSIRQQNRDHQDFLVKLAQSQPKTVVKDLLVLLEMIRCSDCSRDEIVAVLKERGVTEEDARVLVDWVRDLDGGTYSSGMQRSEKN